MSHVSVKLIGIRVEHTNLVFPDDLNHVDRNVKADDKHGNADEIF